MRRVLWIFMLIVEDGSIVANANSYVTLVEVRAFALSRGVTLSDDDDVVEPMAIKAVDYLESLRSSYKGVKVSPTTQVLQWPRAEVYIDNELVPETSIPVSLKNAQCQLCIEGHNGVDYLPTRNEQFVIKEEVGALKTTYSDNVATSNQPTMTAVENWLEPLLRLFGTLTTLRI